MTVLQSDFSGRVVMCTCGVIRGEITPAARLIRHHPHTRTGGPAAVPAPLQQDTHTHTVIHLGSQSQLLNVGVI